MIRNDSRALKIILLVLLTAVSFFSFSTCTSPFARMENVGPIDWNEIDSIEVEVGKKGRGKVTVADENEGFVSGRVNDWSVSGSELRITLGKEDIIITLPENHAKFDLDIETASGRILIETKNAGSIDAESASGGVNINGAIAEDIDVSSASGRIQISGSVAPFISTETVSGSTDVEAKAESIVCRSVSGSIDIRTEKATRIESETVSGSIDIYTDMKNPDISFSSISGSSEVTGSPDSSISHDGTIRAESVSGSLKVHL